MHRLLITMILAALTAACGAGAGGGAKIDVSVGGKASSLSAKSSGSYAAVKTFTDASGAMTKAMIQNVTIANYDLDTTNGGTMRKPLTAADQVRIEFGLVGDEGTDDKAPLKTGVYKVDPAGKFMNVGSLSVATFADGKQVDTRFDTNGSMSKATGKIEVTSVSADSMSGNIDVTDGDKSVKGSFTAKLPVKK